MATLPAWQEIGRAQGFTGSYPDTMVEDAQGRLWVATAGGELYVGDGFRFLRVDLPPALRAQTPKVLACDALNRICLLTVGGLGTLERGTWHVDGTIRLTMLFTQPGQGFSRSPKGDLVVLASNQAFRLPVESPPKPLALPGEPSQGEPSLTRAGEQLVASRGARMWRLKGADWTPLPSLPLQETEQRFGPLRSDASGHLYFLSSKQLYHLAPEARVWQEL